MDLHSIRLNQVLRNFLACAGPVPRTNRRLLLNDNRSEFGQPFHMRRRQLLSPETGVAIGALYALPFALTVYIRVAQRYTGR